MTWSIDRSTWTIGRVRQVIDEALINFDPVPAAAQIARVIDVWAVWSTPLLLVAGKVAGHLYRLGRVPGDLNGDAESDLAIGAIVDLFRDGEHCFCGDVNIDNIVTECILGIAAIVPPEWENELKRAIRWQEVARATERVLDPAVFVSQDRRVPAMRKLDELVQLEELVLLERSSR